MKHLKTSLAIILIIAVWTSCFAFAQSNQDKLNSVNQQLSDAKNNLEASKSKEKDLATKIEVLDQQINQKEASIAELEKQIVETKDKIDQKQIELDQKQVEINVQNDNLMTRLRAMYKNGEVGYMEVLLGSSSFSDLMNNIDMVSRVYEMDEEFLNQLQEQYNEIAAVKKELEDLKASLNKQQDSLEAQKAALDSDRNSAASMREEIKGDIEEYNKMIDDLNKTAEQISSLIRSSQSTNTQFVGGTFICPAPQYTRLSSPYGYRIHPITKTRKLHTGMDFAAPSGSKCIAAGSGTVIFAGWYGGYGNAVIIDHGGGISTLYGHNSSILVSKGQQVTQGQQIAKIGSTGNSTGPHCHFEVRINGSHTNPAGYLGG